MTSRDQTPSSLPASAPDRRPGLAVFFALIPLPIVIAVLVALFMLASTVLYYVLAASGIFL